MVHTAWPIEVEFEIFAGPTRFLLLGPCQTNSRRLSLLVYFLGVSCLRNDKFAFVFGNETVVRMHSIPSAPQI